MIKKKKKNDFIKNNNKTKLFKIVFISFHRYGQSV